MTRRNTPPFGVPSRPAGNVTPAPFGIPPRPQTVAPVDRERLRLAVQSVRDCVRTGDITLTIYRELLWAAYAVCNPDVDSPLEWVNAPASEVANDQA